MSNSCLLLGWYMDDFGFKVTPIYNNYKMRVYFFRGEE